MFRQDAVGALERQSLFLAEQDLFESKKNKLKNDAQKYSLFMALQRSVLAAELLYGYI